MSGDIQELDASEVGLGGLEQKSRPREIIRDGKLDADEWIIERPA